MIFTLPEVLVRIRPGAKWKVTDIHDYKTLEWIDENQTKPTLEELTNNHEQLVAAQPLENLRQERNGRIGRTDFLMVSDFPFPSDTIRQAWITYRQALRDITAINPTLQANGMGDLIVTWPTAPIWPANVV